MLFANMARCTLGAALAELGDPAAEDVLRRELEWSRARQSTVGQATALFDLARFHQHRALHDAARELLTQALSLGERFSVTSTYTWRQHAMSELMGFALSHSVHTDYVRRLIALHDLPAPDGVVAREGWPWHLQVSVLGRPRVVLGGRELRAADFKGDRARRLLDVIGLLGGRDVPVPAVLDALWPDADADRARQNLEFTLRGLRAALGDAELVTLTSGHLSLNPRRTWLDVWEVEAHVSRADARRTSGFDAREHEDAAMELLWPCFERVRDPEPLIFDWRARARRLLTRLAGSAERLGDLRRAQELRGELARLDASA
jgi:hypothetical protein